MLGFGFLIVRCLILAVRVDGFCPHLKPHYFLINDIIAKENVIRWVCILLHPPVDTSYLALVGPPHLKLTAANQQQALPDAPWTNRICTTLSQNRPTCCGSPLTCQRQTGLPGLSHCLPITQNFSMPHSVLYIPSYSHGSGASLPPLSFTLFLVGLRGAVLSHSLPSEMHRAPGLPCRPLRPLPLRVWVAFVPRGMDNPRP